MLLGQYRSRHQIGHLLSLLNRLEGCAECDLCLSVSHIAADQTIHDPPALHILFRIFNGCHLIVRFLIRKHLLKFLLPHGIFPVLKALCILSGGIKLHKLLCDLLYGCAYLCLCLSPFCTAKPVKLRNLGIRACIFLDALQSCGRQI